MTFTVQANDGQARRGTMQFPRGAVATPAFMPVGTYGSVKGLNPAQVADTGAEILLGNTFHLMLRPGTEVINAHGDLHDFMGWSKPILTDSGGFQVFSLGEIRKITEEGVRFRSPVDGAQIFLGPESAIEVQHKLGSDIIMAFDECTPYPATEAVAAESMRLSMRWAKRSRSAFVPRQGYGQFGIVQGSVYPELRAESVAALEALDFEGYAIGGLAVGEGQEKMFEALEFTTPLMRDDKPRYLMGVGKPSDLVGGVARGVDMFDCVLPTRSGRTRRLSSRRGGC